MTRRYAQRAAVLCCLISAALFATPFTASAFVEPEGERPAEFDVREPKPSEVRQPNDAQLKAVGSLQSAVGDSLIVRYSPLAGTPRHLFSHGKYLTPPSSAPAETIAREFITQWRAIWRFSDEDLANLRLKSRATLPDTGTTILLFEQHVEGVSLYRGEVLVNVSRAGQIVSVGSDSFPQMAVTNSFAMSPAQAVTAGAAALGVAYAPAPEGTTNVLRTYGDLPHEFTEATRFSGGEAFPDEIVVTRVIFPMGNEGRAAYQFTLTTPQYHGIMWENIVDATTGQVLRRISLTAFQVGGGIGVGRRGTLRPDVQEMVEGLNSAGTAAGKVFDSLPTALSGRSGFGRSTGPGDPPNYAPDTAATVATGRGFSQALVLGRNEDALVYDAPFGQVQRGFADAANPTPQSPFGWFYLPTDTGGAPIPTEEANANRASTRAHGYRMQQAARNRNLAVNSPGGDGDQPFSATLTSLSASISLIDGRTLSAVFQSNYTEGNNVVVADDHGNDNETTHGIKAFNPDRLFTAPHFTFVNSYEYGGKDAAGTPVVFPDTTHPDIYPGTVNLFYVINFLHDYLYSIGFTESLWNFQQDNFGKGGAGRDAVSGQVQDGSGVNNANFSTPADGSRPRMQMYVWTEAAVRRADGDFDFDVIGHELYHGVSNRSAGKGQTGCLTNVQGGGESGGQGEGWSDFIAESMSDDDGTGEYVVGHFDVGIRRLPKTNFRWSYESINQKGLTRRDRLAPPDPDTTTGLPFAVHRTGEVWSATLWDMRELLIMKDPAGVFFDGDRRLGTGTKFFIGYRQVSSTDTAHPIDYRASFSTNDPATIKPAEHIVRPGRVAQEIADLNGERDGALATAVSNGARLADTLVLRGLQLCPCNPNFVDSRDSILLADRELTGGENQAVIWRAFASHGIGMLARSTGGTADDPYSNGAPVVIEDFTVPTGVTQCESVGPLPPPPFTLSTPADNTVRLTIPAVSGGHTKMIFRSNDAGGPFVKIAEIPNATTTYDDTPVPGGEDFFYKVRVTREDTTIPVAPQPNRNCVSTGNTESILVTGPPIFPPPAFAGVDRVEDPRDGSRLIVSWQEATSLDPGAKLVYDIYRVDHVDHGTGVNDPTFTPSAANRIALGVTGTSYADTGQTLNQVYYYIVQARDSTTGQKDNVTGNTRVKWNAPTITCVLSPAPFAFETFEAAPASSRFTPPLVEADTNPNQASATFQRIALAGLGHPSLGEMYAPNFSPGHEANGCNPNPQNTGCGGPSDFFTQIGPFNGAGNPALTATSIMEFDQTIATENRFDGGVIEVKVGGPFAEGDATPFPNNTNVFDLGDYMIEGGYNSKLDGLLEGPVIGSPLQGRRAFAGVKGLHHTRISLRSFAPGGEHNPNGLPVFIRFRETSDVGNAIGVNAGWFIDNLVVNNMGGTGTVPLQQVVSRKTHGDSATFEVPLPLTGAKGIESRTGGPDGNHTVVFKFGAPLTSIGGATVTGGGTISSHGYEESTQEYVVNLTGVPNEQEITITLTAVNDTCGNTAASISAPIGVLLADTNGDRTVNSGDAIETRNRSGQEADGDNFRSDVNLDGAVNSGDAFIVRGRSGDGLDP